jgi:hypothetical protein
MNNSVRVSLANYIMQVSEKEGAEIPRSEAFELAHQQVDLLESIVFSEPARGSLSILPVTHDFFVQRWKGAIPCAPRKP